MTASRRRLFTRVIVPAVVLALAVPPGAAPAAAVAVPPPAVATLASPDPVDYTPHARNGSIRAFAQIGTTVYAGGSFTGIRAAGGTGWTPASYLVAYDSRTGALLPGFAPVFDSAVQTLAVSPDGKLIVGGDFRTVNGVARLNLVEIDPATGATVTGWAGRADGGVVRRAVVRGRYLYLAGAFHWVNGTRHGLLARLDAATGAIDSGFQVDAGGARPYANSTELVWGLDVSPDGRTVVATGNFTVVDGADRNQVVVIDATGTPSVADWHTDRYVAGCYSGGFPFYARDVDFSDDGSYFAIAADGGRGDAYCDAIARFETADRGAVEATWVDYTGTDSVTSIEAADGLVYVAGHFRWLNNANGNDSRGEGGVDRYGFGALDASNGVPVVWNPGRSPGGDLPSGGVEWAPIVWELWKGDNGLYAGFDSDGAGGEYHGREAMFPTAGGRSVGVQDAPKAAKGYLYLGAGDGKLTKVPFDGTALGTAALTSQSQFTAGRAAFSVSNKLVWARVDRAAPSGSLLDVSMFSGGAVGAPWVGNGFNSWFDAAGMTGAFFLAGRMYYTVATSDALHYRYLTTDGFVVGCTDFTLPTTGVDWHTVRGMAWVDGRIVYGATDGKLRTVGFDPAAATAVSGPAAVVAPAAADATWSSPTLFFATS
ncbi:delta-60 repeat domain-containing protein [Krasilnikovia sp. M28-CT-15]|uniref:delta-60 repeat domain-containing protein n=1 Tax=Krasilnikovia sp. M28-CT-15 TaxID=3373540 RepID=UPI003875E625